MSHRASSVAGTVPPTALVLVAVGSVQLGAAVAKGLFPVLGPGGTVFLRVAFAALVLVLLFRPRLKGYTASDYSVAVIFGLALACMNFAFYSALDRIPLGVAVTLEFVGPLGVAVAGSRRLLDLLWVVLAGSGILLLAPLALFGGVSLDPVGVGLALLAGGFWASYILLSARTRSVFEGTSGIVLAMGVAALALLPVGASAGADGLLQPGILLAGLGVALLSSAVPYSIELEALRRMPPRVFGVLMSLGPAAASTAGFVVLGEVLGIREITAIGLVMVASIGASLAARHDN